MFSHSISGITIFCLLYTSTWSLSSLTSRFNLSFYSFTFCILVLYYLFLSSHFVNWIESSFSYTLYMLVSLSISNSSFFIFFISKLKFILILSIHSSYLLGSSSLTYLYVYSSKITLMFLWVLSPTTSYISASSLASFWVSDSAEEAKALKQSSRSWFYWWNRQ